MSHSRANELSRHLAGDAEAVCRHYLPAGRRTGNYWIVGDAQNSPGGSLYVRLRGPDHGPGAAGKWTDAATQQHGDLLDLIALNRGLRDLTDAMDEARAFLALPREHREPLPPASSGSAEAARRLFASGKPLRGTHAESYLRARGICHVGHCTALRYHPSAFYRENEDAPRQSFPALLAAVTDLDGNVTALHRTWLDPSRAAKAPIADPRRSLGHQLGNGVRFGNGCHALIVGEGLENTLSVAAALPAIAAVAALSANHLAALNLPTAVRRLYVAIDPDPPGRSAFERLRERAVGIEVRQLQPSVGDFNDDLRALGVDALRGQLLGQLAPEDRERAIAAGAPGRSETPAAPRGVAFSLPPHAVQSPR